MSRLSREIITVFGGGCQVTSLSATPTLKKRDNSTNTIRFFLVFIGILFFVYCSIFFCHIKSLSVEIFGWVGCFPMKTPYKNSVKTILI